MIVYGVYIDHYGEGLKLYGSSCINSIEIKEPPAACLSNTVPFLFG